jgi:hypothetical protein
MSIHGPLNPPSDDEVWEGCSDTELDVPTVDPLAEFNSDTSYPTVEALTDAVNAFAKGAGYAVARAQGKKIKGTTTYKRYYLYCTRGGQERASKAKVRNTTTIKTGCQYQCIARRTAEGLWKWERHGDPSKQAHNHEPALDPSAFVQHRVMASPQKKLIKELSGTFTIKSREIGSILQQRFPESCFTRRDIDNQRSYLRAEERDGHTASGALLKAFDGERVQYEAFYDDPELKNTLQGIVFTFPETEATWKRFGNCLGADNTYSTNRLQYPLMVITTMTNLNTLGIVAFALMKDETRETFTSLFRALDTIRERIGAPIPHVVVTDQDQWQKQALAEVWPDTQQQLCRYHMNANVVTQARKKWKAKEKNNPPDVPPDGGVDEDDDPFEEPQAENRRQEQQRDDEA